MSTKMSVGVAEGCQPVCLCYYQIGSNSLCLTLFLKGNLNHGLFFFLLVPLTAL